MAPGRSVTSLYSALLRAVTSLICAGPTPEKERALRAVEHPYGGPPTPVGDHAALA
jgi:hypothetical protein